MSRTSDVLTAVVATLGIGLLSVLTFAAALLLAVLGAVFRALPWIIVIAFIVWLCTGCVYQPINVDVYIPTTAVVSGDVVLDTVGNKLSEVSK